jgi:hypothetical protein
MPTKTPLPKYTVLKDTREKANAWTFNRSSECDGTVLEKLDTADYSLLGFQDILALEKKSTPSELYQNIMTKDWTRFKAELIRLDQIQHAYIILEFSVNELIGFPFNDPRIPKAVKPRMRRGTDVLYRLTDWPIKYPNIEVIFAGVASKQVVSSIFKRMVAMYPERVPVVKTLD